MTAMHRYSEKFERDLDETRVSPETARSPMLAYDDDQYKEDELAEGERDTLPWVTRDGRVLVAEDDDAMRELVVEVLHADGREVVDVGTGAEMLQVLRDRSVEMWPEDAFGVIVTDHRMPDGNGLGAIERIRRAGCSTPILLITAFANDELRARADELDAMVMSKPFPLRAFREAVDVLLSLHASLGRRAPWPA